MPAVGDATATAYFEIPIAIQDRSFNLDGSLFYPDSRFFSDQAPPEFYRPAGDIPPIWNPEFFGNTMVVNGRAWPFLDVQRRRYRFRFLNGCNSRFLILRFDQPGLQFWQIGAEGGFLPAPVALDHLLIAPAERADVASRCRSIAGRTQTRQVTLNELVSGLFDGPIAAWLGVFNGAGESVALEWMDDGRKCRRPARRKCGRSTTSPRTHTRLMCTRSCSR